MIPIEYSTGSAALILHNQSKRTPNKYADQIAYIKQYGYHKQPNFINYIGIIQNSYRSNQYNPEQHNLVCRLRCCKNVFFQCRIVYLFPDRTKTMCKQLLRAQCYLIFHGDDLKDHITYPNEPQQMKN